ncbi:MAG TPA: CHAT domain-containing protein [Planctomycetota bacterium]|nr:CHAT domain-containing protein [Planctomycetota bacterium]
MSAAAQAGRLGRVLLAGLLLAAGARAVEDEPLGYGERRSVTLGPSDPHPEGLGAARIFSCVPDADGPLTVTVEACVGDVLVRLLDADGGTLAEDDNGLFETNARLVVQGHAGQPLRLLAAFHASDGALSIAVSAGDVPRPQGLDLFAALAESLLRCADAVLPPGDGSPDNGLRFLEAGNFLYQATLYARAKEPLIRAGELAAANGNALQGLQVRCLLAAIEGHIGDAATADGLLDAAASEAVAQHQPQLEMFASSNLGQVLMRLGRLDEAQACLERALELAHSSGDVPNEVALTTQLACLADRISPPDEARQRHVDAVTLARRTGQAELLARALETQGSFLAARGECVSAEGSLREALALNASLDSRARTLGELAGVERALSDHVASLQHYEEVRSLGEQLGDRSLQALALTGTGMVLCEIGQLDEAEAALRDALALYPATGATAGRTQALVNLAFVLGESGDPSARLTMCEQALDGAREGNDVGACLTALKALAIHDEQVGALTEALACATEQEKLARDAGAPGALGDALGELAYLRLRLGSTAEALRLATEALGELRQLQSPWPLLGPLATQARAALAQGDDGTAASALAEAETIYDRPDFGLDPEQLSGLRRASAVAACGELAQDLSALHWKRARTDDERRLAADEGLRVAGRWKGRALLEGLLLRRDAPADALGELLAHADGRLQPTDPGTGVSQRAQAVLAKGDVLVEFVDGSERLYAWTVHDGAATLHDLGPRDALAARVAAYVRGLGEPSARAGVQQVASEGRALNDALLAGPLADVAPDARLYIVPDAALAQLPFEALVVKAAAKPRSFEDLTFVLDQREVLYAPSTPVLELLAQAGPRNAPGRALVLGDPAYPLPGAGGTPRGPRDARALGLQRLPGTRDEALGVVRALAALGPGGDATGIATPKTDDLVLDTSQFRLCLGGQAAPDALRDDARQFALIHCAAHGWTDANDPRRTGLALAPRGGDDGFVSVPDVLGLHLDADLAVLSACETSRGGERRGEGTQSLARAFLYAGARSVISSLWQVDDRETQRLMQNLYGGLATRGLTASQALREARLELRHGRSAPDAFRGTGRGKPLAQPPPAPYPSLAGHPFFWAPFIYVGPAGTHPLASLAAATPAPAVPAPDQH